MPPLKPGLPSNTRERTIPAESRSSSELRRRHRHIALLIVALLASPLLAGSEGELTLTLRSQQKTDDGLVVKRHTEHWDPDATAIIVVDMWDLHHSLNATRRLMEFAPRLDGVLAQARERGVTIIHAPSDTMPFYADHPARERAVSAPEADTAPPRVTQWCLRAPAERDADYPIDQFDGGVDDEPERLKAWREHLKALGRDPGTPWKKQTAALRIDPDRDFISSHGDEVWNILEARGIENVIFAGVHLNMCVLGRPFGLRQMVRGGKNVALLRDMTDTMYNPDRWPYVDHFTGTDLMVAYVERNLCPTITSSEFVGGEPFRFENDNRALRGPEAVAAVQTGDTSRASPRRAADPRKRWVKVPVPHKPSRWDFGDSEKLWYRSILRIPVAWKEHALRVTVPSGSETYRAWMNGQRLEASRENGRVSFAVPEKARKLGTANLLVIQTKGRRMASPPSVVAGGDALELEGRWQLRAGSDGEYTTAPLPPKFAASADIVFEPDDDVR